MNKLFIRMRLSQTQSKARFIVARNVISDQSSFILDFVTRKKSNQILFWLKQKHTKRIPTFCFRFYTWNFSLLFFPFCFDIQKSHIWILIWNPKKSYWKACKIIELSWFQSKWFKICHQTNSLFWCSLSTYAQVFKEERRKTSCLFINKDPNHLKCKIKHFLSKLFEFFIWQGSEWHRMTTMWAEWQVRQQIGRKYFWVVTFKKQNSQAFLFL